MKAIEDGIDEVKPTEASDTSTSPSQLHAAAATVEPGTGALRGFYAGQDYLESQINWAVAGGQRRLDVQGLRARGRHQGRLLAQGHLRRQLADHARRHRVREPGRQRRRRARAGQPARGHRELDQHRLHRPHRPRWTTAPRRSSRWPRRWASRRPRRRPQEPHGIPTRTGGLEPNTGVALGSRTVSPINMANGYATIANEGEAAPVYVDQQGRDREGEVLYEHKVSTSGRISEDDRRRRLLRPAAGRRARGHRAPRPSWTTAARSAGKTGTATKTGGAVSSSWFVGFTPQLSTAVMYVRGTGNGQLDDWLPATSDGKLGLLRRQLPRQDVEGDHEPRARRACRSRSSPSRRTSTARRPTAATSRTSRRRRPTGAAAPAADADAAAHRGADARSRDPGADDRAADAGADRPSRRPTGPCGLLSCPPTRSRRRQPTPEPPRPAVVGRSPGRARRGRPRAGLGPPVTHVHPTREDRVVAGAQRGRRRAGRRPRRPAPARVVGVGRARRAAGDDRAHLRAGPGVEDRVRRRRVVDRRPHAATPTPASPTSPTPTAATGSTSWPGRGAPTPTPAMRLPASPSEPALVGLWTYAAARVTHLLSGSPDVVGALPPAARHRRRERRRRPRAPALRRGQRGRPGGAGPARHRRPGRRRTGAAPGTPRSSPPRRCWPWPASSRGTCCPSPPSPARCGRGRAAGSCSPARSSASAPRPGVWPVLLLAGARAGAACASAAAAACCCRRW